MGFKKIMFSMEDVEVEANGVFASVDRLTAFSIVQSLLFQLAVTDKSQDELPNTEHVEDDLTNKGERLPPR